MGGLIEARNLSKVYGKRPERAAKLLASGKTREEIQRSTGLTVGVQDVSLQVERGELYMLMGLSGSGKSTVLRMLNGLNEPTSGTVVVDGHDLSSVSAAELREIRNRKISMVFQHFALLPHKTVRENAAYGLKIRGTSAKELAERADWALETVGLKGWGDQYPSELSGGMKQRVGLARGLATDADVLLMDEPFSALDPLIRREMQDLLLKLRDEVDRTIVFVTHDLDEAMRLGDRITLLGDGLVAQTGTAAEILTNPADEYVRRFVGEVDRTRVLTARDVMQSGGSKLEVVDGARHVSPDASLGEIAGHFSGEHLTVPVVENGELVGVVSGGAVLEVLATANRVAA
jgi:glycine betaine/proline transport system ATP-binding protein